MDHVSRFKALHHGKDVDPLQVLQLEKARKAQVMPPYLLPPGWREELGLPLEREEVVERGDGARERKPHHHHHASEAETEADLQDPMREYLAAERGRERKRKEGKRRRREEGE